MSARETHSCFGMEKNSTDLRSKKRKKNVLFFFQPKSGFYLRALLSASTPPATRIPSSSSSLNHTSLLYIVTLNKKQDLESSCVSNMHHMIYLLSLLSFQHVTSLTFPDRYSVGVQRERKCGAQIWVAGKRKCEIKGGEWSEPRLINTIVLTCAAAIMGPEFCLTMKVCWKLEAGYKIWKRFKIFWLVKRFQKILLLLCIAHSVL